jgi:cell division protein FtsB
LKAQHEEEMETLQKENSDLKSEIDQLKKKKAKTGSNVLDQSIEDIEGKIGEFDV